MVAKPGIDNINYHEPSGVDYTAGPQQPYEEDGPGLVTLNSKGRMFMTRYHVKLY